MQTRTPPPPVLGRYSADKAGTTLARDLRTGGRVAVVRLPGLAADPADRQRAFRAFQAATGLAHPHVLPTLDFGADGPDVWVVTAEPGGPSLTETVTTCGPLPAAAVVRLTREVAAALDHARAAGVLHDDLTPDRVYLRPDGTAVVDGWGVAAARGRPGAATAEDVADLGELAYFAATGRHWADGVVTLAHGLLAPVACAVAPEPAGRPRTAGELARMLAGTAGAGGLGGSVVVPGLAGGYAVAGR